MAVGKALFEVPDGAATRCRDGGTVFAAIVDGRAAFGAEHCRGLQFFEWQYLPESRRLCALRRPRSGRR